MLFGFVQNCLAPRANPIGVDLGTDSLRLAQVQRVAVGAGHEYKLLAAASADLPHHVRRDAHSRIQFFTETTRELLSSGQFRGRQAILALPAASMFIQHLRIAKMDDAETRKALPWESRGKLPIDPSQALIRHMIAGEVYHDQEPRNEVIVMAAAREFVNQLLAAAARAKLDVIGMNVEPKAIVDCLAHVYRRKTDRDVTNFIIDIGCCATRAIIARGQHVFFARSIPIGGDHFTRAAAQELRQGFEETKLLRVKLCAATGVNGDEARPKHEIRAEKPTPAAPANGLLSLHPNDLPPPQPAGAVQASAPPPTQPAAPVKAEADVASRIEQACREPLNKLVEELDLCRRYHEATFPGKPVDRLVFVGGEARQRWLCQHIASELGVAAQLGDPLMRMGRISEIDIESGIDRRQPQPGWAVAIGLSLGPNDAPPEHGSTAQSAAGSRVQARPTESQSAIA